MSHVFRLLLSLTLILGLAVGVACWQPAWGEALGVDFWNVPEMSRLLRLEEQRGEAIAAEMRLRREQARRKDEVLTELIDGRLNLAEAVERVIRIGGDKLVKYDLPSADLGDGSVEEQVARLLRQWAHRRLADQPGRLRQFYDRIDREAEGYVVRHRVAGVQ